MSTEHTPCSCMEETNEGLNERGFRFSGKLRSFQIRGNTLKHVWLLPIERTDGKRLKASDPKSISITHCPFCGKPLDDAPGKEAQ